MTRFRQHNGTLVPRCALRVCTPRPDTSVPAQIWRIVLLHWSNGISRYYWYARDGGTWGVLWDPTKGGVQPAGVAYRQIYSWMVEATMNTPVLDGARLYLDLWVDSARGVCSAGCLEFLWHPDLRCS
jgi:hypothetical protein